MTFARIITAGTKESFAAHERTEPNKARDSWSIWSYIRQNGDTGATWVGTVGLGTLANHFWH
jgi:hypothetical protein